MTDELTAELRAVGFTEAAKQYPRDDLALRMFAAFNGVTVDQLPEGFRYFPNECTAKAWGRVADTLLAERERRTPAVGTPVAWLHPTANWCDVDRAKVLIHCQNDGPFPAPLYAAPASSPKDEAVAWEATESGIVRFVTDSRYRKFSPSIQRWYKPYRCSSCAAPSLSSGAGRSEERG